jgi:AhpD family alkylhydroperoxidase
MTTRTTDRNEMRILYEQLRNFAAPLASSGLEPGLIHLVKLRASQINGCARCMVMHFQEALEDGDRVDRLAVLSAWRDTSWFSDREQAALAWTEAVTTLANGEVPDEVFEQAQAEFGEKGLVDLTLLVITINGWNRINVPYRTEPSHFEIAPVLAAAAD